MCGGYDEDGNDLTVYCAGATCTCSLNGADVMTVTYVPDMASCMCDDVPLKKCGFPAPGAPPPPPPHEPELRPPPPKPSLAHITLKALADAYSHPHNKVVRR